MLKLNNIYAECIIYIFLCRHVNASVYVFSVNLFSQYFRKESVVIKHVDISVGIHIAAAYLSLIRLKSAEKDSSEYQQVDDTAVSVAVHITCTEILFQRFSRGTYGLAVWFVIR